MKKIILLSLSVLMTGTCLAQLLPKKSYMRLQGYLNNRIEVTMNLVKVDDSLYADYCLSPTVLSEPADFKYFGAPETVGGRIADDNSFTLQTPFDDEGTKIIGKFITRQTMAGTWETEKGGAVHKFSLTENYPAGSQQLGVWFQEAVRPIAGRLKHPRAYSQQCLVVPIETMNPVSSDTVRNRMMSLFASGKPGTTDPQILINTLQEKFFQKYLADNLELYIQQKDAGPLDWDLYKLVHIVFNERDLLSFYIESYAFTSGAHGLGSEDYTVISLKTGKTVTREDLFNWNYEGTLTTLLTEKLKKMENLGPGDKLSEKADYFVDEIVPNNNFYITANGIGFLYNHYEIAPYAHGFTNIFLTFDELETVIRPEWLR